MNDRIARLQERLEQPLLVTNPVNVVYLVGFDSSNAALVVERDRVRLFTDFRYIQAARAVEDVEIVQTKRNVIGELAETLTGASASRRGTLTYASYEVLERRARPSRSRRTASSRSCARSRTRASSTHSAARARSPTASSSG